MSEALALSEETMRTPMRAGGADQAGTSQLCPRLRGTVGGSQL